MKPGKRTGEYRTALKTSESEGGLSIWRISGANEDNPFHFHDKVKVKDRGHVILCP